MPGNYKQKGWIDKNHGQTKNYYLLTVVQTPVSVARQSKGLGLVVIESIFMGRIAIFLTKNLLSAVSVMLKCFSS
jgi:hypothetical protein